MGQRTMLYVVETLRDQRTGRKTGYKFSSRYYQWGIGRTMPLNILGGVLAAYNGGYSDGIHAEHIIPESKGSTMESAPTWKMLKDRLGWENNNGAVVVQLDNTFNPKTWERTNKINISFMIGSEDAYGTKWKTGDELTLKEWLKIVGDLNFMNHKTREFFRQSCEMLKDFGDFKINYGFAKSGF